MGMDPEIVKLPCLAGVWAGGLGRNPVTARMKWNKAINIAVMECYFLSSQMDENDTYIDT